MRTLIGAAFAVIVGAVSTAGVAVLDTQRTVWGKAGDGVIGFTGGVLGSWTAPVVALFVAGVLTAAVFAVGYLAADNS